MLLKKSIKDKSGASTTTSSPDLVKGHESNKDKQTPPNKVKGHGSKNKNNSKDKKQDIRQRNWTFLVYPKPHGSAPDDWREQLKEKHIRYIIGPLHDKDIKDKETGELKPPHYHVILLYPTKKSFSQVKEITESFNSPIPEPVFDIHMMVRYLCHLDDPEKAPYSKDDIETYGDVNLDLYLKDQGRDKYKIINEILDYCEDKNILEFQDVLDFARKKHYHDWFPLLCNSSGLVVQAYIRSNRDRKDRIV